jgi:hypothetical protein
MTVVFVGPLMEELFFRGVLIGGIGLIPLFLFILFCDLRFFARGNHFPSLATKKEKKCLTGYRVVELLLLLSSSWVFALYHLSLWGSQTLPYYFIKGVIYGILFLRYGLISSLLAHMTFNFFSLFLIKTNVPDIVSVPIFILLYFVYTLGWEFTNITLFLGRIYQKIWLNFGLFTWSLLLLTWPLFMLLFSTFGLIIEPSELVSTAWIPIVIILYYGYIVLDVGISKFLYTLSSDQSDSRHAINLHATTTRRN